MTGPRTTIPGTGPDTRPVHGDFEFNPLFHEPGARTILGVPYGAGGVEQGEAVLADLVAPLRTAAHTRMVLGLSEADCRVPGLMEALIPREDESHGSTEEVSR